MKELVVAVILTILALCLLTTHSWAQSMHHHGPKVGPNASAINYRVRGQFKLIKEDTESGKITDADATSLKASLKSIHEQEATDIKQNGNNDITADQANALTQLLDLNLTKLGAAPGADQLTPEPSAIP